MATLSLDERPALLRRGRVLEIITIAYNSLEGVIAIVAGLFAGSIALVGFGFDSAIEVTSGAILLWRLHARVDARGERSETLARRAVGVLFLLLATGVAFDAAKSLWLREAPEESIPGIVLAVVSVIAMPLLVRAKRRVADALSSGALHADSRQTELCMYLSAILLAGLLLNALLGWWWADPVAALVMVPIIANEGVEALRGEECGCSGSSCST